jgi:hypothetical protein
LHAYLVAAAYNLLRIARLTRPPYEAPLHHTAARAATGENHRAQRLTRPLSPPWQSNWLIKPFPQQPARRRCFSNKRSLQQYRRNNTLDAAIHAMRLRQLKIIYHFGLLLSPCDNSITPMLVVSLTSKARKFRLLHIACLLFDVSILTALWACGCPSPSASTPLTGLYVCKYPGGLDRVELKADGRYLHTITDKKGTRILGADRWDKDRTPDGCTRVTLYNYRLGFDLFPFTNTKSLGHTPSDTNTSSPLIYSMVVREDWFGHIDLDLAETYSYRKQ